MQISSAATSTRPVILPVEYGRHARFFRMAQGQCRIRASLAVAVRATNGRENVLVSAHGCVAAQFVPAHRLSHESRSRDIVAPPRSAFRHLRSEEHTSELQSLMRISYAVF